MPGPVRVSVFSGELGRRLFGPLLDAVGEDLAETYSGWRASNLARTSEKINAKLDPEHSDWFAAPRAAAAVLEAASWSDAEVMSEYFGGIMASARSEDGKDDRAVTWAGLVARLSTVDVHLHYLIYQAFRRCFLGESLNLQQQKDARTMAVYLPAVPTLAALGLPATAEALEGYVVPALTSLVRERLVDDHYAYGSPESLGEITGCSDLPDSGAVVRPSIHGAQLFLIAHGVRTGAARLIDPDLLLEAVDDLGEIDRAQTISDIQANGALQPQPRVIRVTVNGQPD